MWIARLKVVVACFLAFALTATTVGMIGHQALIENPNALSLRVQTSIPNAWSSSSPFGTDQKG
jgi:hypothetical protein